jgi:hypothetical protein
MTNTTDRLIAHLAAGDIDNAVEDVMDLVGRDGVTLTMDMATTWLGMVDDVTGRAQLMDVIVANSDLFPTPGAMDTHAMRILKLITGGNITAAADAIVELWDTDGAVITRTMAYAWLDACTDPINRAYILDTIRDNSQIANLH